MNGFSESGLDEGAFGESKTTSVVKAFDAFPKTKPSYQTKTQNGGVWTLFLAFASFLLAVTEVRRWYVGETHHTFSVEKGISHNLQLNLDVVVAMKCDDLHINVQDASGDRIMASQTLSRNPTMWSHWQNTKGAHHLGGSAAERGGPDYQEEDVHDYLGAAHKKKKFAKTPRLGRGATADSCRVYGSLELNKVQGDFHITARGHGYMEFGQHLDHQSFNFSHQINELSFGPFYPGLDNPLDNTRTTTDQHFEKFQYYLSVVPTVYTDNPAALSKYASSAIPLSSGDEATARLNLPRNTIFTNQYAVTEQSHIVSERQVPGIFVKFDIEPLMLTIAEEWGGFLNLLVRLVNVVSGVLVAGGWVFQIQEWANEVAGRRRQRRQDASGGGVLTGRKSMDEKH
ncbi:hypothetical protein AUEXF2481DRAFT_34894 [Aureobasidium subglaciale EXF-2481]|uniref:Endoplasmic reticulum-Golgi intermediate compartment protein n=1 Tax=Aureobasidium subglaciale (strain EXF-2481) TaxID=1043005 RepID=A0A074YWZ4_AURSE|nr:uncharacterized protein AUEXF2481DRAFT_34894 [Aureobasidium subglaciale EXF-2481]KAI5210189.1 DUF1692-domain-containing protein [Aureobasidium subglaciale]KAI5266011.1 DUF1692-domain-containing protein [Aureobasidium subglaciale]KER00655.1 hypothetical protein AUEXF2481DRAFT_34894 [Aureobasidium subglaciale EXF-2481]